MRRMMKRSPRNERDKLPEMLNNKYMREGGGKGQHGRELAKEKKKKKTRLVIARGPNRDGQSVETYTLLCHGTGRSFARHGDEASCV